MIFGRTHKSMDQDMSDSDSDSEPRQLETSLFPTSNIENEPIRSNFPPITNTRLSLANNKDKPQSMPSLDTHDNDFDDQMFDSQDNDSQRNLPSMSFFDDDEDDQLFAEALAIEQRYASEA